MGLSKNHLCFQTGFTNCPSGEATRAICETLKTQVKLNLNLRGTMRILVIIEGKIYSLVNLIKCELVKFLNFVCLHVFADVP